MHANFADGLLWYSVFLFSTVFHEAAHAWTALKLGDDTASRGGQVSINPVPHIKREPIGMVVMPVLTWLIGGWLMGWASAPYDAVWARTFPRRAALMAMAGPAANLVLVAIAALLIRVGVEWNVFSEPYTLGTSHVTSAVNGGIFDFVAKLLSVIFSLNLLLAVFNLLPLPPLDGSSLPLLVLPQSTARAYFDALHSPILRVVGFVIVSRGLGAFFPPVLRTAANVLYPGSHFY
jgi:Zn-dependent protease